VTNSYEYNAVQKNWAIEFWLASNIPYVFHGPRTT